MNSTSFLLKLATFFGVGKLGKAPGTMGTIATIPLVILTLWLGPLVHMGICLIMVPLAILAAQAYESHAGSHDAKEIVIDEVVGFLITMTWMPLNWKSLLAGFCLFRLLDIWKPFPISYLDKNVKGGVGVVADDVLAGIVASLILQVVLSNTLWLA